MSLVKSKKYNMAANLVLSLGSSLIANESNFFFPPPNSKTVNHPTHLQENISKEYVEGGGKKKVKCHCEMGYKHTLEYTLT